MSRPIAFCLVAWMMFITILVNGHTIANSTNLLQKNQDVRVAYIANDGETSEPIHFNPPVWSAIFDADRFNVTMRESQVFNLTISYIDPSWGDDFELHVLPVDSGVLQINRVILPKEISKGVTTWSGNFSGHGILLGHTNVYVELRRPNFSPERSIDVMEVIVLRKLGILDIAFQFFAAAFVFVLYINFGAVLDLDNLKSIVLHPVGPAIGFMGQFLLMPLLSFLIGYTIFPNDIELRLGLFFTGCAPAGGSSNMFTVLFNGNLDLSITMTAISNLAAFFMMPFWIFTLGSIIFAEGNFTIPYGTIGMLSFSLVVPLIIGIALQKYVPNISAKMSKALKPVSLILIILLMIFGLTVNSFMFKLFSPQILIAASALPWLGYLLGWTIALICRQSWKDSITIGIETGVQNIGIAIFMLNFTLPQPQADMTSAVPIAISMMTPLPLLILYLIKRFCRRTSIETVEEAPTKEGKRIEVEVILDRKV